MTNVIKSDKFLIFQDQIKELTNQCNNIIIADNGSLIEAKEIAKTAGKLTKAIEAVRKEYTVQLDNEKKVYMDIEKKLTAELEEGTLSLRGQIRNYEIEVERKKQLEIAEIKRKQFELEEAERIRIQNEQLVAIPDVDEETGEVIETFIVDPLIETQKQSLESITNQAILNEKLKSIESNKTSLRYVNKYRVIDLVKVPLKYLQINDSEVQNAMKAGITVIDGLEIYKEPILNLR